MRSTIASLRHELSGTRDTTADFADIRQRLGWLLTALRHQRGRDSDLLYEAYYDTFDSELDDPAAMDMLRNAHPSSPEAPQHTNQTLPTMRADRARSLDALQEAERLAETAAMGREDEWMAALRASVPALESALAEEAQEHGVLADIARTEPRLHTQVGHIRDEYRRLAERTRDLYRVLDGAASDKANVVEIRNRLDRLANELRSQRAREADLIYEAYMVDLGSGD